MLRAAIAATCLLALGACTMGHGPPTRYDRLLTPRAEVSKVVATELAFARAARERGQWTAFAEYAADGAMLFGQNGAIEAKPWLKTQTDPPEAVSWQPHRVWSSCDGTIAVTQGGFRDPAGTVGTFNTVWHRQADGEYLYAFDFGIPQDAAPVAPDIIQSGIASCAKTEGSAQPETGIPLRFSRDRTLAWGFQTVGEGERLYAVWIAGEDGWEQVVDIALPASATAE